MGSNSNYENGQSGMMQPQQQQLGGAGVAGAMMPSGGQQGGMMTQPGQQGGMMTQPGQQGGMMGASLRLTGHVCLPNMSMLGPMPCAAVRANMPGGLAVLFLRKILSPDFSCACRRWLRQQPDGARPAAGDDAATAGRHDGWHG
jgi:hypothetical protein